MGRCLDGCRKSDRGFAKVSELLSLMKKIQIQSLLEISLGSFIERAILPGNLGCVKYARGAAIAMFPTIGREHHNGGPRTRYDLHGTRVVYKGCVV